MDNLSFSKEGGLNVTTMFKAAPPPVSRRSQAQAKITPPPFLREQSMQSKLAEKEMEIAVNLHKRLLPEIPESTPGISLFLKSVSALQVGGDYLGCRKTDDGSLWFIICDAMGKGMHASFFSLLFHMAFQAILQMRKSVSPGEMLTLVNQIMAEDFKRFGMFMTSCAGKVDAASDTLLYASAGHCPPILYSERGTNRASGHLRLHARGGRCDRLQNIQTDFFQRHEAACLY